MVRCIPNSLCNYHPQFSRYVLLKERNMLLTLDGEARKYRYQIPAPKRKEKVGKSDFMYDFTHLTLKCTISG